MKIRRMLPTDIAQCLRNSDINSVVSGRRIETQMTSFLADLMLTDQHWGSVVEDADADAPICFGSCIFISNQLARGLLKGEYPFLLADLCQNHRLRTHILSFNQVEEDSERLGLNFYGALFTFARTQHPLRFGAAMNSLQRSLVNSMSGFGIGRYVKQCYGQGLVYSGFTSAFMRLGFGANIVETYENRNDLEVKRHRPLLFSLARGEALEKPNTRIHELLCPGAAVLNLPPAVRMMLKLEIEGYSHDAIGQALMQGDHNSNWSTALNTIKRNDQFADFLGINEEAALRNCVRDYVRQNPQELGVLPPLTPEEKHRWIQYGNLDSVAAPNRKGRRDQGKVA